MQPNIHQIHVSNSKSGTSDSSRANDVLAATHSLSNAIVETIDSLSADVATLRAELEELRNRPSMDSWMDRREAAAYLRCHPSTVDEMAASGRLPKFLLGTKPLYRVSDLDAVVAPTAVVLEEAA